MVRVLIEDLDLGCAYDSPIECYPSSGAYILTFFDLHATNPYLHVVVSRTVDDLGCGYIYIHVAV